MKLLIQSTIVMALTTLMLAIAASSQDNLLLKEDYEGGHGWQGDVFGNIRKGINWLDAAAEGSKDGK